MDVLVTAFLTGITLLFMGLVVAMVLGMLLLLALALWAIVRPGVAWGRFQRPWPSLRRAQPSSGERTDRAQWEPPAPGKLAHAHGDVNVLRDLDHLEMDRNWMPRA